MQKKEKKNCHKTTFDGSILYGTPNEYQLQMFYFTKAYKSSLDQKLFKRKLKMKVLFY